MYYAKFVPRLLYEEIHMYTLMKYSNRTVISKVSYIRNYELRPIVASPNFCENVIGLSINFYGCKICNKSAIFLRVSLDTIKKL